MLTLIILIVLFSMLGGRRRWFYRPWGFWGYRPWGPWGMYRRPPMGFYGMGRPPMGGFGLGPRSGMGGMGRWL